MKTIAISIIGGLVAGCASFGFIDNEKFVALVNEGKCQKANEMIAASLFSSMADRWAHLGTLEYFCFKNKEEGVRLLTKAAREGSTWAATTLARNGERLPEGELYRGGAAPTATIYIQLQ